MSPKSKFKGEAVTMYLRNIPKSVRDPFLSACAARGIPMNKMIAKLMKKYVRELGDDIEPRKKRRRERD